MWNIIKHNVDRLQGKAPKGKKRSSKWRKVRAAHVKRNPTCAVCGGTKKLEVHHIIPFHECPGLELVPENLMTLCESKKKGVTCHQFFGHLGNYKKWNETVREDVVIWNRKLHPPPATTPPPPPEKQQPTTPYAVRLFNPNTPHEKLGLQEKNESLKDPPAVDRDAEGVRP